ncbi:hypothetical protein [Bosea thiooxidans]
MSTKGSPADQVALRANKAALAAQRRVDAESALQQLRAEQDAVRERTARLRALRLAKEAADNAAAAAKSAPAATAKPARRRAQSAR